MLKFSKDRAIQLTETDDSGDDSESESDGDVNVQFKEALKASVMKSVQLKKKDRKAIIEAQKKINESIKTSLLSKMANMNKGLKINKTQGTPFAIPKIQKKATPPDNISNRTDDAINCGPPDPIGFSPSICPPNPAYNITEEQCLV